MTMNDIFLGAIRMHTQKGIHTKNLLPTMLFGASLLHGRAVGTGGGQGGYLPPI